MKFFSGCQAAFAAFLLNLPVAFAAEPTVTSNDLPRFPAHEPLEALKTFQIKKGFHVELAACEPNIASPVAIAFDENGRMFVVEMIDYSERRDETPHLGRIRMLEDKDGDGIFERSTIYAENLPWPTGVICCNGGILVGTTPDIIYLKDSHGDGKADVREVVFSGFAEGVKRINVQAMLNSFIWGLDNRIHGATSGNGGVIKTLLHPDSKLVELRGRDFVIEPRRMTMNSEAGGGQHGLSFDNHGRRFACNNSDHIRLFMYDDRYASRNPLSAMPPDLESIAVDGPAAEVYRISPDEPWRVIRTRWRVAGLVGGPIEGGGRASGYFTGATGTTIYRGDAYPQEFLDNAFIGDAGGNLVHRKLLLPVGVGLKAQRPADEEKVEFMASTDTWFRPVQFANAPDGTLFVIDMYREVIEHPWSLPENIKKFLDLNSGNNRGRIYRIAPDGFKQPKPARLGSATTSELVAILENRNGWHRDTASRLIYERQDSAAIEPLKKLLQQSKSPLARLQAIHALDGIGAVSETILMLGLNDEDETVREHSIKLSEASLKAGSTSTKLLAQLVIMATDKSAAVRYQLAFTLGEISGLEKIKPLIEIARQDVTDQWIRAAIMSSLAEGAGVFFAKLAEEPGFAKTEAGRLLLRQVAILVGAKNEKTEISGVVAFIGHAESEEVKFALTRALGEGLRRAGATLESLDGNIKDIVAVAGKDAMETTLPAATRLEAIRLLRFTPFGESGETLLSLLALQQPQEIQLAAVETLAHFNDPAVVTRLIERWDALTPRMRTEAVTIMLARPDRAIALLEAIRKGMIRSSVLTTTQTKFVTNHPDKRVREVAALALDLKVTGTRQQIIDSYMPALNLKGDAVHGRKIYEERCISCHRLAGEGFALGPDLVTVKNTGKEKILVNVLDPNREVRPDYISYVVETKDDESVIGLIGNETANSVTLRQAYGKENVINRSDIRKMQSQGQSLMPEGLEAGLKPQDFADLIEFIETAEAK